MEVGSGFASIRNWDGTRTAKRTSVRKSEAPSIIRTELSVPDTKRFSRDFFSTSRFGFTMNLWGLGFRVWV